MFALNTKKLTAITAAFTAILGVGLTIPNTAEAASYKICGGVQSASLCLQADGSGFGIAPQGDSRVHQVQYAAGLQSGMYFGTWKDGTTMVERISVSNGTLTMQRMAGGHGSGAAGPAVTFFQTGPSEYTNQNGSKVFVASPTTFTWRNSNNRNHVFYHILN